MIKANHHIIYEKFFDLYLGRIMRNDFRQHRILELPIGTEIMRSLIDTTDPHPGEKLSGGLPADLDGRSVLMIGNHFSWWDGFIARAVNRRVIRRKLHVMMLEEQLLPRMFLTRIGAYSIRQNHRSALETVNYTLALLENPENLVVMFPQGRFQSLSQQPVSFEKGWFRILQKAGHLTALVCMVNLVDYFDHRKPTLTSFLRMVDKDSIVDAGAAENAYNDFLRDAISAQGPFVDREK